MLWFLSKIISLTFNYVSEIAKSFTLCFSNTPASKQYNYLNGVLNSINYSMYYSQIAFCQICFKIKAFIFYNGIEGLRNVLAIKSLRKSHELVVWKQLSVSKIGTENMRSKMTKIIFFIVLSDSNLLILLSLLLTLPAISSIYSCFFSPISISDFSFCLLSTPS